MSRRPSERTKRTFIRHSIYYTSNLEDPPSYTCACVCGWKFDQFIRDYMAVEKIGRQHVKEAIS